MNNKSFVLKIEELAKKPVVFEHELYGYKITDEQRNLFFKMMEESGKKFYMPRNLGKSALDAVFLGINLSENYDKTQSFRRI